jgi:hypothetical protein
LAVGRLQPVDCREQPVRQRALARGVLGIVAAGQFFNLLEPDERQLAPAPAGSSCA